MLCILVYHQHGKSCKSNYSSTLHDYTLPPALDCPPQQIVHEEQASLLRWVYSPMQWSLSLLPCYSLEVMKGWDSDREHSPDRLPHRMHQFHWCSMQGWRYKSNTEFFLQHLTRQIGIRHIYCVVLVPLFWDIPRNIIHKDDKGDWIHHPTLCFFMEWMWYKLQIFFRWC